MTDFQMPAPGQPFQFPEVVTPNQPPTPENTFTAGRAPVSIPGTAKAPTPLPPSLRQSYADAMAAGQTLGPGDFHDAYHAAGHEPIPDLAPQLPNQQDLIDTAINALHGNSIPPDPEAVSVVKQNLMDHWAATGQTPAQAIQDPEVRDQMARVPNTSPPIASTIQRLETGGLADPDAAVSRTGAIGRNQIEPSTAREYGFDPAQLHDAAYNNMVRDTILTDLTNRFHGENAAVLIAYNAGPGMAEKWIASGRDNSVLPQETRDYLTKAARGGTDMTAPSPGKFDPAPSVSFSEKVQTAAAGFADKFDDWVSTHAGQYGTLGDALKRETPEEKETAEETAINFTPLGVGSLAGEGLRSLFGIEHEDPAAAEFAKATIRSATGSARRFIASASEALESFRPAVNKGIADYSTWLAKSPGVAIPMWGPETPAIPRLIDHIEGGFGGGKLAADHPLRPVADALAKIYQDTRARLEANPNFDGMSFIEDYYRHSWLDTLKLRQLFSGAGRLGSAASTKLRKIPTLMGGIAKGLTPRILDPIENALHYVSSMVNYEQALGVFQAGRDAGYVKYGIEPPEAGWVPLKGRSATIAVNMGDHAQVQRAYAPAGFAQAYNSFVGQGVYEWLGPKGVKVYDNLQRMANLSTALKLSVSGYHYLVIAQESVTAGIANAIGEIAHGELIRGFKDMGLAVTIAPHLAKAWRTGGRVTEAYLGHGGRELDQKLADIIEKAGGRVVGRGAEYAYTQASNWGKAFRRGSLAQELKVGLVHTLGLPEEPVARRATLALPRVGAFFGHELGRIMGTVTAPLFDKIIPRLKTAALADEIATFLRQNPLASEEAILAHARRLTDSMDDRFGEMIQDNLFWNRTVKQALNLFTVSIGWEYGTLRGATGAVKDIMHGDMLSPRARWLAAVPATMGLFASVYQYIKTGLVGPSAQTPGRDMVAPRTGGQTPEGATELALLPGQQKDFLQWFRLMQDAPNVFELPHAIGAYVSDKINPFGQVLTGTFFGHDWLGNPVWSGPPDPKTMEPPPGWESYAHFVLNELAPINLGQPRLRGTNISPLEHGLGIRPAPEWLQNPERVENAEQREQRYQQRQMLRQQRRYQGRLETPPE